MTVPFRPVFGIDQEGFHVTRLPCPKCGNDDWQPIDTGPGVPILVCARCGVSEQVAAVACMIDALNDRTMASNVRSRLMVEVTKQMTLVRGSSWETI
jgi:ribosomal protein S27AE